MSMENEYIHLYRNKYLKVVPEKLYSWEYSKDKRGKFIIDEDIRKFSGRNVKKQKLVPYPERFIDPWKERQDYKERVNENPLIDGFNEIVFKVANRFLNFKEYNQYCIGNNLRR